MTILPHKKPQRDGNCEKQASEHSQHGQHVSQASASALWPETARSHFQRNSPPPSTWPPQALPARNEPSTSYDSRSGSSKRHERRHNNVGFTRVSPHRNVRKHRHDKRDRKPHKEHERSDGRASGSHSPKSGPSSPDGYNSGDEHLGTNFCLPDGQSLEELELCYEAAMKEKHNFTVKKMADDGACLFRAVSDQVYGDQEMHSVVRRHCMDYMCKNRDFFSTYITEDFDVYINRKRREDTHGNYVEMQAMSEMYNRAVEVYEYHIDPINIFQGMHKTDNEPIRISYHRGCHYNSVVNPYKASVGVGLGLPAFQPGVADKNLLRDAFKKSEDCEIEQTMLNDKMRATDFEATSEALEQQVANESYLEYLRSQQTHKEPISPRGSSSTSSAIAVAAAAPQHSPKAGSSLKHSGPAGGGGGGPSTSSGENECRQADVENEGGACGGVEAVHFLETESIMNSLPPTAFGLSDWEEDSAGVLAQVIAASQQEYLDSLKAAKRQQDAAGSGQASTSRNA